MLRKQSFTKQYNKEQKPNETIYTQTKGKNAIPPLSQIQLL